MKTYYIQHNVGKAKYIVNYHDGKKTHADDSPFFDIAIFNSKPTLNSFTKSLEQQPGYTYFK